VVEPLRGAREETVVLDTREVVELDAEDISVGGWAAGRRGFLSVGTGLRVWRICCHPEKFD
jgi:hypothetical protein